MRNLITMLAIALFFSIGTQQAQAQRLSKDNNRPETLVKERIAELDKELDLTDTQERTLFRVMMSRVMAERKAKQAGSTVSKATENKFKKSMRETLTKEQFESWQKIRNNSSKSKSGKSGNRSRGGKRK